MAALACAIAVLATPSVAHAAQRVTIAASKVNEFALSDGWLLWTTFSDSLQAIDLTTGQRRTIAGGVSHVTLRDDYAAWSQEVSGGSAIRGIDLGSGATRRISTTKGDNALPDVGTEWVTWTNYPPGTWAPDIWGWNRRTGRVTPLLRTTEWEREGRTDGEWMVYTTGSSRSGEGRPGRIAAPLATDLYDVRLRNLDTGDDRLLALAPDYNPGPTISGRWVVWQQVDSDLRRIWSYDILTGIAREVSPLRANGQFSPALDGDWVTWTEGDASVTRNLRTGFEFEVPDASGETKIVSGWTAWSSWDTASLELSSSRYAPVPWGWQLINGSDSDRSDDWGVWTRVMGLWDPLGLNYQVLNGSGVAQGEGLFEGGNCYGMAASSLVAYVAPHDTYSFTGVAFRPALFGLWAVESRSSSREAGFPRFSSKTEDSIRRHIEAYQLVQLRITSRGTASSTRDETIRRLNSGQTPPIISIFDEGEGHALIPWTYRQTASGTEIGVYDCNHPGDTNRSILVAGDTWSYDLGWTTWRGSGATMTWDDPDEVMRKSTGLKPAALDSQDLLPVAVRTTGARGCAVDTGGRRVGYVAGAIVNEIAGARVVYPDATADGGTADAFGLPMANITRIALDPLAAGSTSVHISDADTALAAVIEEAAAGRTDSVDVNLAADAVSVVPAVPGTRVTLWASKAGKVMYGALDATTTAGDLQLSIVNGRGRIANTSKHKKSLRVAAVGVGLVGRQTAQIDVPAMSVRTFWSENPADASGSGIVVADATGQPLLSDFVTRPFGSVPISIRASSGLLGAPGSVFVTALRPHSPTNTPLRLERSYDGRSWTKVGTFPASADGIATSLRIGLSQNAWLRATSPNTPSANASTSQKQLVSVRAKLTLKAPSRAIRGRAVTLTGTLSPAHRTRTSVTVSAYRSVSGRWVKKASRRVAVRGGSSALPYRTSITLSSGRWKLVATHADGSHVAGPGATRYVTVN